MLLRLAYSGMTNAFAMLRLLPMSNRDKDVEILALRHQITVLERHLGKEKVRFAAGDRAFLAALLHFFAVGGFTGPRVASHEVGGQRRTGRRRRNLCQFTR